MRRLVLFLMIVSLNFSAGAVLVFSDDFEDGNRSGWYGFSDRDSASPLTVKQDTGPGTLNSGYALFLTNPATYCSYWGAANINTIQLVKPGDYVRLSIDLRLDGVVDSVNGLRFGVFNSAGTPITSDNNGYEKSKDDAGYFMRISTGSSNEARITFEPGSDSFFMIGADMVQLYNSSLTFNDANKHHFDFDVKLTKDGGVEISLYVDGSFWASAQHSQSVVTTFNEIGFCSNKNGGVDFAIDNIAVAYIPEPATMVLGALGGLICLAGRKQTT